MLRCHVGPAPAERRCSGDGVAPVPPARRCPGVRSPDLRSPQIGDPQIAHPAERPRQRSHHPRSPQIAERPAERIVGGAPECGAEAPGVRILRSGLRSESSERLRSAEPRPPGSPDCGAACGAFSPQRLWGRSPRGARSRARHATETSHDAENRGGPTPFFACEAKNRGGPTPFFPCGETAPAPIVGGRAGGGRAGRW